MHFPSTFFYYIHTSPGLIDEHLRRSVIYTYIIRTIAVSCYFVIKMDRYDRVKPDLFGLRL